ncbi:MAG: MoaD/ThiS family protein [Thermodesulfobacteriota bacterium]
MGALVRIPIPLRRFVGDRTIVEAQGATVFQVLEDLGRRFPGVRERLYDGSGLRPFINIYLNDEDIRFLEGQETLVKDGDLISVVPAIAGG